ncbi:MAG: deoxyribose-phosphate aldolase [Phycisphaeraceae bacterium]|nr:deoxyribose-phosphate aldolase [Phycisphaeraceae bacterium]
MTELPIARYLDHAVLKPEMSQQEAIEHMQLGIDYNVRTICVRPVDIPKAVAMCKGTQTEVSCVLAFPHGVTLAESKTDEAKRYVELGVAEIDMVVNYGLIRSGLWELVEADILAVTKVAKPAGVKVKTIFETCNLDADQIAKATEAAIAAQADFVKTSTGFASGGATKEAVQVMVDTAAGRIEVKPSGGIRDLQTARMYIQMGATRLGVGSTTTPVLCDGQAPSAAQGSY